MELLDYFYQNPIKAGQILNRKKRVEQGKTIIKGAFNCGKSYFAFEWLKKLDLKDEEILYIDFEDFRIIPEEIFSNLENFLKENSEIQALCLKNLNFPCSFDFNKIKLKTILITSELKNFHIENFAELNIHGLDFEEFIAFFDKNLEQSSLFSQFLIYGNGVKNLKFQNHQLGAFLQSLLKAKFDKNEILILMEAAKLLGKNFSAHEIYRQLKANHKISKDKVYQSIKDFENRNLLHFCPHFESEQKRLFFYDFSFKAALNFKKDFHATLLNALFCELQKLELKIFYNEVLDFILPEKELGILLIPFSSEDLIYLKFKKIFPFLREKNIKSLKVISINKQKTYFLDGIKCEILPFWQYALSF